MTALAPRSRRTAVLASALLHLPLAVTALLMLQYGWIVQVLAMGCDTGAEVCRFGLRDIGEALATSGPLVVLAVSVVVSAVRIQHGRESGWVPILGLLAAVGVFLAAAIVVLAGIGPHEDITGVLQDLADHLATGDLRLPIGATYPLDRVTDAFEQLERGHTNGKIALLPQAD